MDMPEIMTIEEVAKYLRVSSRTVYDWAQRGEIPCGKLGTSWRFMRSEIERWVERRLGSELTDPLPKQIQVAHVLTPDRVIFLEHRTKKEALEALIEALCTAPEIRNKEDVAAGIFRREELMSTGMGQGIAIPHVRLASVSDIVMAVGVAKEGIPDYGSLDGQLVQLVFMIAAERDQHAKQLRLIAALSRCMRQELFRVRLLEAPEPQAVYDILMEDDSR